MENIADGADPPTHPLYPLCRPVVWGRPFAQGRKRFAREKGEARRHLGSHLNRDNCDGRASDGREGCVQTAHARMQDVSAGRS